MGRLENLHCKLACRSPQRKTCFTMFQNFQQQTRRKHLFWGSQVRIEYYQSQDSQSWSLTMLAMGCFNQRFVQPSVQNTKLALQFGNLLLDRFPVAAKHKAMAMGQTHPLSWLLLGRLVVGSEVSWHILMHSARWFPSLPPKRTWQTLYSWCPK